MSDAPVVISLDERRKLPVQPQGSDCWQCGCGGVMFYLHRDARQSAVTAVMRPKRCDVHFGNENYEANKPARMFL